MSTTHNLPYVRFTKQAVTEPMALLSTNVAAAAAAQLLQSAPWVEQTAPTPTFPARASMLTVGTPSPVFDAYKYCGDYADGKQKAYAGAVAYGFKVPAAALTGPTDITSIAVPIYVDRWLVDGVRVSAYLSDSSSPPSDWAIIRAGDINTADVLPMTYTDPAGERIVIEKNGTTTLNWPVSTASKKYIYVILTLEDYATTRGFWIEGAGLIHGAAAVTVFGSSVAADPAPWVGDSSQIPDSAAIMRAETALGPDMVDTLGGYTFAALEANPQAARSLWHSVIGNYDVVPGGGAYNFTGISAVDFKATLHRHIHTRAYHPAAAGEKKGLVFVPDPTGGDAVSLPAPTVGLVGRVLVYYVPGVLALPAVILGALNTHLDANTTAGVVARRAFWEGTLETFPVSGTDTPITAVLAAEVDKDYPLGHVWPVTVATPSSGIIVVATTVSRVARAIPVEGPLGCAKWTWMPWNIELR